MNNKFYFLLFLLNVISFNAQILEEYNFYPKDQFPYEGGEIQFYKDFHDILIANNLKPCEDKHESYNMKVIISETGSVKYLKDDSNNEMAEKNKCAYDLGLKVASKMTKWKPLIVDGEKKQAIGSFYIIPNDLFDNYKEGYFIDEKMAMFDGLSGGGINEFRKEVVKRINLTGYKWNQAFKMQIVFVVNRQGEMEDFKVMQSSGLPEFDQRVISGIKNVQKKKKWTPATINGEPVRYRFKLPLSFSATQ